jgi:4-aminobutyrate aminotransferase
MSEAKLESLHFADAPRIISTIPGPKTTEALALSARTESMARGGARMPVAMDRAFGATFKDPDGNTYIDLSAGVGVSSVGPLPPEGRAGHP